MPGGTGRSSSGPTPLKVPMGAFESQLLLLVMGQSFQRVPVEEQPSSTWVDDVARALRRPGAGGSMVEIYHGRKLLSSGNRKKSK